ncbi:hypothetical protein NA78x_000187 [Anatilimnocola sp. NA78]|uniref:hypothetical protein n=1 Tax=Anatilimnocola sp. NA78 TaxID=3415683 RepID=UPI003CE52819
MSETREQLQFGFSTIALLCVVIGLGLSGLLNNPLSCFLVVMALICWFATTKVRDGSWALGVIAVCGWLFLAALIAFMFRR